MSIEIQQGAKLVFVEGNDGCGKSYWAKLLCSKLQETPRCKYFDVTVQTAAALGETTQWFISTDEELGLHPESSFVLVFDDLGNLLVKCGDFKRRFQTFFDVLSLYYTKWRRRPNLSVILVVGSTSRALESFETMRHPVWQTACILRVPDLTNEMRRKILSSMANEMNIEANKLQSIWDNPSALVGATCKDLRGLIENAVRHHDMTKHTDSGRFVFDRTIQKSKFDIRWADDLLEKQILLPMGEKRGRKALIGREAEFELLYTIANPQNPQRRPAGVVISGAGKRSLILRVAQSLQRPLLIFSAADVFKSQVGALENLFFEIGELFCTRPHIIIVLQDIDCWGQDKSRDRLWKAIGDIFTYCEFESPEGSVDFQALFICTASRFEETPDYLRQTHLFKWHIFLESLQAKFGQDSQTVRNFLSLYLSGRSDSDFDMDAVVDALNKSRTFPPDPARVIGIIQEAAMKEVARYVSRSATNSKPIVLTTEMFLMAIRDNENTLQDTDLSTCQQ